MKTAKDLLEQTRRKPLLKKKSPELLEIEEAIRLGIRNADIAEYFGIARARVSQIKKAMEQ